MNYLQWLMFSLFFGMGFGIGYLRGIEVGKVEGYLRRRAVERHISNLVYTGESYDQMRARIKATK